MRILSRWIERSRHTKKLRSGRVQVWVERRQARRDDPAREALNFCGPRRGLRVRLLLGFCRR